MKRCDRSRASYEADGERLARAAAAPEYQPPADLSERLWRQVGELQQGPLTLALGAASTATAARWAFVVALSAVGLLAAVVCGLRWG